MKHQFARHRRRRRPGRGPLWVVAAVAAVIAAVTTVVLDLAPGPARAPAPAAAASAALPAQVPPTASATPRAARGPAADPSPSSSRRSSPSRRAAAPHPSRSGPAAAGRQVTLVNRTSQTVWAAATPDARHPLARTGWVLAPGASTVVGVPNGWGGRFWGRTGCRFDAAGHGHCTTGDCAGGLQCTGSGATPATLAELALDAWGGMDFYDVSMVDGSNLPMFVNISHTTTRDPLSPSGCSAAGCTRPVVCPTGMQVKAAGSVVACTTACAAFGGDAYCCQGAWAGRANCAPSKWPVDYTRVFKQAEPFAYSYAFDDSATMSCKGACDYRITFGTS